MMESLDAAKPVIGFVRHPILERGEEDPVPLNTDWHSASVGCLGQVLEHKQSATDERDIVRLR